MSSGIYAIKNRVNGKVYIGQTINLERRWIAHKSDLRLGRHDNDYLQKAWTKHGEEVFEFSVLEECKISSLTEREQYWMDALQALNRDHGYNLAPAAGSMLGYRFTEEQKLRLSEVYKGLPGHIKSPEELRKLSEATRRQMANPAARKLISDARKGKALTPEHRRKLSEAKQRMWARRRGKS